MTNKYVISLMLDLAFSFTFLFYIFYLGINCLFSTGGTFIFVSLIGLNNYLSFLHKELALELSLLSLIVFSLMALNYLAYIEYTSGLSTYVLVGVIVLIFILHITCLTLVRKPLVSLEKDDFQVVRTKLRKKIMISVFQESSIFIVFLIPSSSFYVFMQEEGFLSGKNHILFTTLSLVWLLVGLSYSLILLKKRNYLNNYIPLLVLKKYRLKPGVSKKWISPIIMGNILPGFVFELYRGLWYLWFISCLALVIIIGFLWSTWKYVFKTDKYSIENIASIKDEEIDNIPSINNPNYLLKYGLILMLIGFIYMIILGGILFYSLRLKSS